MLVEAILGRLERSNGRILVGGVQADRLSLDQARRAVGYVPQTISFLPGTIQENITGFDLLVDQETLVQAAGRAMVHALIMDLRDGCKTVFDAAGSFFSKSERHMIALTRALYGAPKILIVDKPDQAFREGLPGPLNTSATSFIADGAIMNLFSRKRLQAFRSHRCFGINDGQMREIKQGGPQRMKKTATWSCSTASTRHSGNRGSRIWRSEPG